MDMIIINIHKKYKHGVHMKLYIYRIFLYIFEFLNSFRRKNDSEKQISSLEEAFKFNWNDIKNGNVRNAIIIFSSAIGEFNAVRSFIDLYLENNTDSKLIILSYDPQYTTAYHAIYPEAIVGIMPSSIPDLFDELAKRVKPNLVAIAEGPCLFCHFPLRLDLSLPAMCLFHKIPLIILNATPWPRSFISRIYKIEYYLFRSIFEQAVTAWFTPYQAFKNQLVLDGATKDRINVVGDMKYDISLNQSMATPSDDLSYLLDNYRENYDQPLIVAGSVSSPEEQIQMISAWAKLREKYPKAKLVLAPRQINQFEAMEPLRKYLKNSAYSYAYRSSGKNLSEIADIIILDVYGELMHFYSIASICYIGRNHGVLEPLIFHKPTLVGPSETWNHDGPTYLMYRQHVEAGSIVEISDIGQLGANFIELFEDKTKQDILKKKSSDLIYQEKGASLRINGLVQELIREKNNV